MASRPSPSTGPRRSTRFPELRFALLHVLCATRTVTLVYDGALGVPAEVFLFGDSGKVAKADAHYKS